MIADLQKRKSTARHAADSTSDHLDHVLQEVSSAIAPVWPLKDYVAVNPFKGQSHRHFLDVHQQFHSLGIDILMPLDFYRRQYQLGGITIADIKTALKETALPPASRPVTLATLLSLVQSSPSANPSQPKHKNVAGRIRTVAEFLGTSETQNWPAILIDEISKHCAAHFDEGQASWQSPWKDLPLYQAWRETAKHDWNLDVLGISNARSLIAKLPESPREAIPYLLQRLRVPQALWTPFLLCQAFSILGWSAWAKYQDESAGTGSENWLAVLSMRLAYDVSIAEAFHLSVQWDSYLDTHRRASVSDGSDSAELMARYLLQSAFEVHTRDQVLHQIQQPKIDRPARRPERPQAQFVFCIDVRSERMRRQLEWQSLGIETYGFAGFFGMPLEYQQFDGEPARNQLPVLLKPQISVVAGNRQSEEAFPSRAPSNRMTKRLWKKMWRLFQTSAASSFACIESTGLWGGWKLLTQNWKASKLYRISSNDSSRQQWGPMLPVITPDWNAIHEIQLAENMLRNLGLSAPYARLVVLCGHECQTENNPLASGLECGACGGHSGEPNARFAAMLLNRPEVRQGLEARGYTIPQDTIFLAAVHNTTTDRISFYDTASVPESHREELQSLQRTVAFASDQTRHERQETEPGTKPMDLDRRARDWSEVRPEWGLAGNALMIVGPRELTQHIDLGSEAFLHSYNPHMDRDGSVLELIMTAPMIVANWINLQYYASSVDNNRLGSGDKTIHNVVGQFGILAGNSGDLKTGLPWQSLHNGSDLQHLPRRLTVMIAASRTAIDRILQKHTQVANLATRGWLHLVALEDQQAYRLDSHRQWHACRERLRVHRPQGEASDAI